MRWEVDSIGEDEMGSYSIEVDEMGSYSFWSW